MAVVALAILSHAEIARAVWGGDLASPDEPAHFVSGVMAHDAIRTFPAADPMGFAESYYVRYPKVAIGHWPPVYYAIQGLWYLAFGPTVNAGRALSFAITLAIATLVFISVRGEWGVTAGALASSMFLAMPMVRAYSWALGSDLLEGLFVLLAVLAFARYLKSFGRGDAGWFVLWSSLAILTKGNGWALGIFALLAPLVTRRAAAFRQRWYWLAGVAVLALSAPFYLITWKLGIGYADNPVEFVGGTPHSRPMGPLLVYLLGFVSPLVLGCAGAAGAFAFWWIWRRGETSWATLRDALCLTWILSQLLFFAVMPLSEEVRAMAPSLGPAMVLFGSALARAGALVGERWPAASPAAVFLLALLCVPRLSAFPERVTGYAAAAASIPISGSGSVMLVSGDASGTGAFIAARLERDVRRRDVLLRDNKVLWQESWGGGPRRELFRSEEEIGGYLQSVPVRYVVIDQSAAADPSWALLQTLLKRARESYEVVGVFAVKSSSGQRQGEIAVYRNLRATREPEVIEVDLGASHGNRKLRYRRRLGE